MTRLAFPWALVLLPLAPLAAWWMMRRRRTVDPRAAFPEARALALIAPSPWARIAGALPWMRGAAIALVVVALARPQSGTSTTTISSLGIDVVIALDVSGSMRCEDTRSKNRLSVAKRAIDAFVDGRPGDRIGLVSFAAVAATRCPLTLDHAMLDRFVSEVDFAPAGQDGTALGMGLASAVNRLRASKAKSKVVVLVTDGKNNAGAIGPEAAMEAAKALGIRVYTIGVGSKGVVPCLVVGPQGTHYVPFQADLDEALLQRIAHETGGRYWRATDAKGLMDAFHEINTLEKTESHTKVRVVYTERFAWALAPAGLLLGLELLLVGTRLRRLP